MTNSYSNVKGYRGLLDVYLMPPYLPDTGWVIAITTHDFPDMSIDTVIHGDEQQLVELDDLIDDLIAEPLPPERKLELAEALEELARKIRDSVAASK